jgi:ABC-type proline/glycine betaine transport system substrate-binding protein
MEIMKLRNLKKLGELLAIALAVLPSQAQTPAILMFDDGIGSIQFAAGDVRTALEANGYSVTVAPLGDPSVATQSVRFILTTEAVVIPGKPATTGLSSQGYAIQRVGHWP